MNDLHRNRLLAQHSRAALEEDFIQCCEELDQTAPEIQKLESQAEALEQRLVGLEQEVEDRTKQKVSFDGPNAPIAFRQTQVQSDTLLDHITRLELRLTQLQVRESRELREVRYFRSLHNFPGRRVRAQTSDRSLEVAYTRDDLARMLSEMLAEGPAAQMVDRLQATIAILNHEFSKATGPLRRLSEASGENHPLFQGLDLRREIAEREKRIEELRGMIATLGERHNVMAKRHAENVKRYQTEAEENDRGYRALLALQHEKDAKEAEAMKLTELRIKMNDLQQQKAIMDAERAKIEQESAERIVALRRERSRKIAELNGMADKLERERDKLSDQKAKAEREIEAITREINQETEAQKKLEEERRQLPAPSAAEAEKTDLMRTIPTDIDVFFDEKFQRFLQDLSAQGVAYGRLADRRSEADRALARSEKRNTEYQEYLNERSQQVAKLGHELEEAKRSWEELLNANLRPDETVITLDFEAFTVAEDLFAPGQEMVFLIVHFVGFKPQTGRRTERSLGNLRTKMIMRRDNNAKLKEALAMPGPEVKLCVEHEAESVVVASGMLDLRPFLAGQQVFAGTMALMRDDRPVGKINFEASLHRALID
jgi:myosin heavy subunit